MSDPSVLILRLTAPLQSWGVQSRFTVRDTAREPSKSGVVGLLGAALGRPRDADFSDLNALLMAVRVDRPGALRRDYHTAGGGSVPNRKAYGVAETSADPSKPVGEGKLRTVVSHRYYLADADFRVALQGETLFLRELERALQAPRWPLFLGRKAFTPTQPLCRGVREGLAPIDALRDTEPWFFRNRHERAEFEKLERRCRVVLELRGSDIARCDDARPDSVDSFQSRDFQLRHVCSQWLTLNPELIQEEDKACSFPR